MHAGAVQHNRIAPSASTASAVAALFVDECDRDGPGVSIPRPEIQLGYYDQAHLIAEFRAIAGVTPRALLGELRGTAASATR